jgi:vanadium chloroperoxidase
MQDPILYWNEVSNDANKFDHTAPMKGTAQGGPTRSSRAMALVHLAMHDAHFGVTGGQTLYLGSMAPGPYVGPQTPKHVSSAVTAAAQVMLCSLFPEQVPMFEAAAHKIAAENETDMAAHLYGRNVANALLALRTADGADTPRPHHVYSLAKPHHRGDPINPELQPLGAFWGEVQPFAIQNQHQLASFPPLTDPKYLADHEEVMKKGGAASQSATTRTVQETTIGLYWAYDGARELGTPPRLYNQIVQVIAKARNNSVADNARLFALVNAAMGDSGIYAWHYKYLYDLWRPVIGIREYDRNFGWDATGGQNIDPLCDPYWRPLGAPKTNDVSQGARSFTPPFPAYPSGHATFGAAAFEMVRLFYKAKDPANHPYGQDDIDNIGFEFVSAELNGVSKDNDGSIRTRHERRFTSLADAMFENSVSRIYLGVHWRFDGTSAKTITQMLKKSGSMNDHIGGVPLGRDIARDIFSTGLTMTPGGFSL